VCYRWVRGLKGDLQLTPTTRDEAGVQLHQIPGTVMYQSFDHTQFFLEVKEPMRLRHMYEEDVVVPPGLYRMQNNTLFGGAPLDGIKNVE
jgi:hypothetical protein